MNLSRKSVTRNLALPVLAFTAHLCSLEPAAAQTPPTATGPSSLQLPPGTRTAILHSVESPSPRTSVVVIDTANASRVTPTILVPTYSQFICTIRPLTALLATDSAGSEHHRTVSFGVNDLHPSEATATTVNDSSGHPISFTTTIPTESQSMITSEFGGLPSQANVLGTPLTGPNGSAIRVYWTTSVAVQLTLSHPTGAWDCSIISRPNPVPPVLYRPPVPAPLAAVHPIHVQPDGPINPLHAEPFSPVPLLALDIQTIYAQPAIVNEFFASVRVYHGRSLDFQLGVFGSYALTTYSDSSSRSASFNSFSVGGGAGVSIPSGRNRFSLFAFGGYAQIRMDETYGMDYSGWLSYIGARLGASAQYLAQHVYARARVSALVLAGSFYEDFHQFDVGAGARVSGGLVQDVPMEFGLNVTAISAPSPQTQSSALLLGNSSTYAVFAEAYIPFSRILRARFGLGPSLGDNLGFAGSLDLSFVLH